MNNRMHCSGICALQALEVDKSAKVIVVYNGKRSGTMFTIQYAQEKHVPVEYLAG